MIPVACRLLDSAVDRQGSIGSRKFRVPSELLLCQCPLSVKSANLIKSQRISAIHTDPRSKEVGLSVKVMLRLVCNDW
jgi:hypothetical protein